MKAKEVELGSNKRNNICSEISNTNKDDMIKHLSKISNANLTLIICHGQSLFTKYVLATKNAQNTYQSKFIVASPKSSIKFLAKTITLAFQLLNGKCRFFTGVNAFWVVQNSRPVVNIINKLKRRNTAKYGSTFILNSYNSIKKISITLRHHFCM